MSDPSKGRLTPEQIDALALEGLNLVRSSRKASGFDYDIAGYRRVPRCETSYGEFRAWDLVREERSSPKKHPEYSSGRPIWFRLAGFLCDSTVGAEAFWKMLRTNHLIWNSETGHGNIEDLVASCKHGVRPYFELVAPERAAPLSAAQQKKFRELWTKQMESICERLRELETRGGVGLIDHPEQIWVVMTGLELQPLDILLDRAADSFEEVNADFKAIYGFDLPLEEERGDDHTSTRWTAKRIKLWAYLRRRYSEVALIQTEICRKFFKGIMVSNVEFDTEVDYRIWGTAFDMPGFNLRTALFEDEIGYRCWVGYGTRLCADLTHRAPVISVRTNLVAAGARIIPTRNTTRFWYSQAVQNGAGALFVWARDYPANLADPRSYFGSMLNNPDPSARSAERWATHLEMSRKLTGVAAFQPPSAQTGILVSLPSCAAGQWPSVFSAYIELTRAKIFARFISTVELRDAGIEMNTLKILFVPASKFEHTIVVSRLIDAVQNGVTVIIGDARSFLFDENGDPQRLSSELTGVCGLRPHERVEEIEVEDHGSLHHFRPYATGSSLILVDGAATLSRYEDGEIAVAELRLGRGRVITYGAPVLDIYSSGQRSFDTEDDARSEMLQHWHSISGAADDSWVFDVDADNVMNVTS